MTERLAKLDIDPARMRAILDGINRFGRGASTGGYDRPGFGEADMAARRWLAGFMEDEGLAVSWDAAGNLFGRLGDGHAASVMAGSHTDTVPRGGAFDGTLGVVAALECVLTLRDAGLPLAHPLEVVDTAEEEGRFGGMLGSQAMAGLVDRSWLETATDPDGVRLWDAMIAQGLDPAAVDTAARQPGSVAAFLELHVEQGPVLERAGASVGIADRVSGLILLSVRLEGVANHSGTTPMEMRADAFAGLAAAAAAIPRLITRHGSDQSRITIGKVDVLPNTPHTIPGSAEATIVLRDTEADRLARLDTAMRACLGRVAARYGLRLAIAERSRIAPARLDVGLADLLTRHAERLHGSAIRMASGAGHDAQTMQELCPSGLVFVRSRGGVSHSPEEWTDWPHAVAGAQVLLAAMAELAVAPDDG